MSEAAFKATFHNIKNVMGRKTAQIILEVPIEQAPAVTRALGWPDPSNPAWVAVARMEPPAE